MAEEYNANIFKITMENAKPELTVDFGFYDKSDDERVFIPDDEVMRICSVRLPASVLIPLATSLLTASINLQERFTVNLGIGVKQEEGKLEISVGTVDDGI